MRGIKPYHGIEPYFEGKLIYFGLGGYEVLRDVIYELGIDSPEDYFAALEEEREKIFDRLEKTSS